MCRCAAAIARAVVAFLDAILVGCFLSCFRPRPDPDSAGSDHCDPLVPKDGFEEVLSVSDNEKGFGANRGSHEDLADGGGIDEELRREYDGMPTNALAMGGTSVAEFNSSEGFKCEEDHTLRTEINIEANLPRVESVDSVPRSAFQEKSPFWSIKNRLPECSDSPFPTPLVLRDDMQTPGTIYTSHKGSSMSRKRVRTCKHFVYPVLRPIENKLQRMELTEDSSPILPSNTLKRRNLGAESIKKQLQQTSSNSMAKVGLSKSPPFCFPNDNASYQEKETLSLEEPKYQIGSPNLLDGRALSKSHSDEKHAALSLTHWLKPSSTDVGNQGDVNSSASDQLHDENTLSTESPVFTASGMNWDVENPTPRLPKACNVDGIPNTTTKYKEDQKVSWHTTPFEERLLKVLSDENPNPPRKLIRANLFHVEET